MTPRIRFYLSQSDTTTLQPEPHSLSALLLAADSVLPQPMPKTDFDAA